MATLTYKKAPLINKGDKITSKQYNTLVQAFNDRITGGAADVAYRIWWYAHSLVRSIRNPEDEYNWPQTDEWWKLYGPVNPISKTWPKEGGPGEPAGINLSNPLGSFVFGRGSILASEANRVYLSSLGDVITYKPTSVTAMEDQLKIWYKAKAQRGYISAISHTTAAPVYEMTRYTNGLTYSYLAPYLKAYTSYRPTPYATSAEKCPATAYFPMAKYVLRFEPLIENLPILEFPACPGVVGHVQYITRGENNYTLVIAAAADSAGNVTSTNIVVLPYNQYLETGSTGGGTLYKDKGEHINQMLNNYISDAKGTEQEVKNNNYIISKTGFKTEEFLTSHFKLAPAIGSEIVNTQTGAITVIPTSNSYPVFRVSADSKDHYYAGGSYYPSATALKVGTFLQRAVNASYTNTGTATAPALPMQGNSLTTLSEAQVDFAEFEDIGCLGGYIISYRDLKESVTINIYDYALDEDGNQSPDAIGSVLPAEGAEITLNTGYGYSGVKAPYNITHYYKQPRHYDRLKVKITKIGDSASADKQVSFNSEYGYIHIELLQQVYYMPTICDAYGIIRLGSTNGKNQAFDVMLRTDFTGVGCQAVYANYYDKSIIHNPAFGIGDPGEAINVNPVYESTRKFIIDNLRMAARQQLTGYGLDADKNSVLYFRKTLAATDALQTSTYGKTLTPVDGSQVAKTADISAQDSLVAGGLYLVITKGDNYWKTATGVVLNPLATPNMQQYGVRAIPPITPDEFIIYANTKYRSKTGFEATAISNEITGEASKTINIATATTVEFPILQQALNSYQLTTVSAITKTTSGDAITVRWCCKNASNADVTQLVLPNDWQTRLNNINNGLLQNGYVYEVSRVVIAGGVTTKKLVASSTGNGGGVYALVAYKETDVVIRGGFYFVDKFTYNSATTTLRYEIKQIPVPTFTSTNIAIVPKINFVPAMIKITDWVSGKFYKIVRVENGVETPLTTDHVADTYIDNFNLDYNLKKTATITHKVYVTSTKGVYTGNPVNAHTYASYTAAAWLAGGRAFTTNLVPYDTFDVFDVKTQNPKKIAIQYKLHGTAGDTLLYDQYSKINYVSNYYTKIATVGESIYWGESVDDYQDPANFSGISARTVNKNLRFSANTVNFSIESIKIDNVETFVRNITLDINNVPTVKNIGEQFDVSAEDQATVLANRKTYTLCHGTERIGFSQGYGIEKDKTYFVRAEVGAYVTYGAVGNTHNYSDGATFVGIENVTTFTTSDSSVLVLLVESNITEADLALFDGLLGPEVTPTIPANNSPAVVCDDFLKITDDNSDDIYYTVLGGPADRITYTDDANVTHEVAGSPTVPHAASTFLWKENYYDYKWVAGNPKVVQANGIIYNAPQNGLSNEWSLFLSFNHYNTSQSSVWKPNSYGDILPILHNRCHTDSYALGFRDRFNALRKQFAFDQKPIMLSEASPGYTYLQGVVGANAPKEFYDSCQVYVPPYRIKTITLLPAGYTDAICNVPTLYDQVVITLYGRLQHAYNASDSVNIHLSSTGDINETKAIEIVSDELYRTDENGIREYLIHMRGGQTWNCRKNIIGDQAPDGDLYSMTDDPNGCCYPRVYFIRNVRKVYDDIDPARVDEVDFNLNPNTQKTTPRDTPMVAYDFRVMEFYLRAMCGGYLNLAAARKGTACLERAGYEDSAYADYTFEDLCYQAMRPLLAPIDCAETGEPCVLNTKANLKNRLAVSATAGIYEFRVAGLANKAPIQLENNRLILTRDNQNALNAYYDDAAWEVVPGISFELNDADSSYHFTVVYAIDGDIVDAPQFRLLYSDGSEKTLNSEIIKKRHVLFFPFLGQYVMPDSKHTYSYEYATIKLENNVIIENTAWEKPQVDGVEPTPFSFQNSCLTGCVDYAKDCLKLDSACNPYSNETAASSQLCENCRFTIDTPPALGNGVLAVRYRLVDHNPELNVEEESSIGNYTLTWPAENYISYDLYVKYHFKNSSDEHSAADWELYDSNVKPPYTVYKDNLNLSLSRDVTDLVETTTETAVPHVLVEPWVFAIPAISLSFEAVASLGEARYHISDCAITEPTFLANGGSFTGMEDKCSLVFRGKGIYKYPNYTLNFDNGKLSSITFNANEILGDDGRGIFAYNSGYECELSFPPGILISFSNEPGFNNFKSNTHYNVKRTTKVISPANNNYSYIVEKIGEIYEKSATTAPLVDYGFTDTFDKPRSAYSYVWSLTQPGGVKIHWHAANPDAEETDADPKYNAYMLNIGAELSDTNPKKLSSTDLDINTQNPFIVSDALLDPTINPTNLKFYVQAEWENNADMPVSFRIQPKSQRKNRWFSPLPMTLRTDIPKGFGMLPYTCAYAEMFDHYSNCINLLTKCRLDIPVTLQSKKDTIYTFSSAYNICDGGGCPGLITGSPGLREFKNSLKAINYQTQQPFVETQDWTTQTAATFGFELISSNNYGQYGGRIFTNKIDGAPVKISTRETLKFRILPTQAVAAIPDTLKALAAQNKFLITVNETIGYQVNKLFGIDSADLTAFTAGNLNWLPGDLAIGYNDPKTGSITVYEIAEQKQPNSVEGTNAKLYYSTDPDDIKLLMFSHTTWQTTKCQTHVDAEYGSPPAPTGQALPYKNWDSPPYYTYTNASVAALTLAIGSFMPYIDVPLIP